MAALAQDRITQRKESGFYAYPVAATTKIYQGALVALNTAGYAVPAADTVGFKVVGVARAQADNTLGAAGELLVQVETGRFRFPATSITQAMLGKPMYVVDDQTFDDATGTNEVFAGVLVDFISTTDGWIEIPDPTVPGAVVGAEAGYKVARGQHTTVAASDTVVTGLASVVSVVAVLDDDPVAGAQDVTASIGNQAGAPAAGSVLIKTWKATATADTAQIAATTFGKKVNWIAVGV